ncbi:MAG: ABC transporter permease subunit [Flavobacteriaceae bacterium]|nr:ABC transporter permease subunit [Flavobacteriaceae bacterium]
MLRLLQIEFKKLWLNKASKVLIISYFALIIFIAGLTAIKFNIGSVQIHLAEQGIFNFPYIWHANSWVASFFKIFFAVVIVSMVANEYSNKTLKQNLIDGLSKKEFLLSKLLTVLVFTIISTLFVFLVSLILGLIYSDYNEISIIFSDLEYLLAYFIKHIGFFSFCLFIGILIKRSAFALGFLAIWFIFEEIIIKLILGFSVSFDFADSIINFLPLRSSWNVIDEPISRISAIKTVAAQVGEDFNFTYGVEFSEVLIVLVWTTIFITLSYRLLKKRDL